MENTQKTAVITGIGGQDGHYLAKFLIGQGYKVHGLLRENAQRDCGSLNYLPEDLRNKIHLTWGNVLDHPFMIRYLQVSSPNEIYHLAGHSFVGTSFESPQVTYQTNIFGTLILLDIVHQFLPKSKVYLAGSSEQFGECKSLKQNESSEFIPQSPYAVSKITGYFTGKVYRESYKLFICNGILFNHESEIRGSHFVTRKISKAVANIKLGKLDYLELGNLDIKRDWGYAEEYVKAMWLMLQQEKPDDFVIATGESHTLREFVEEAFKIIGKNIIWIGKGENEIGTEENTEIIRVRVNKELYRPLDVSCLNGDYSKAKTVLGWEPTLRFKDIVKKMVEYDLREVK